MQNNFLFLDYSNFDKQEEYIESLVKEQISKKRKNLVVLRGGIHLNYKRLSKFKDLEEIKTSVENNNMKNLYYTLANPISDKTGEYNIEANSFTVYNIITRYAQHEMDKDKWTMDSQHEPPVIKQNTMNYAFKSILKQFKSHVEKDIEDIISSHRENPRELQDALNRYVKNNTNYTNLHLTYIDKESLNAKGDKFSVFLKDFYHKKFKKWNGELIEVSSDTGDEFNKFYYPVGYSYERLRVLPHFYDFFDTQLSIYTRDITALIAVSQLSELCFKYFNRDEYTKEEVLKEFKLSMNIFDYKRFLEVINREEFIKDVEKNEFSINPDLINFFVVCMSNIISEELSIQNLEKKLKKLKSNYATAYKTKKNIPDNILEFMEDNEFLEIFSYVEADESCDVDKLRQIEEEFEKLTRLIPMKKMDTYSLRFRRLGRQNAGGLYYPTHRTLCVDTKSVSSFMHEYFHMLDYDYDILSLDSKFKPLYNKSRDLILDAIYNIDESNTEILIKWNSSTKYSHKYYLSKDEVFARLGEIYIKEILNIKTSFNKREFNEPIDKIIYRFDDELLEMINDYYSDLFKNIFIYNDIVRLPIL